MRKQKDRCELRYEVSFHRDKATRIVHAQVRAKYAPKRRVALCGVSVVGMLSMAPHGVGRSRPFVNGPGPADIDFESVAADPFFSEYGCEGCAQRLAF